MAGAWFLLTVAKPHINTLDFSILFLHLQRVCKYILLQFWRVSFTHIGSTNAEIILEITHTIRMQLCTMRFPVCNYFIEYLKQSLLLRCAPKQYAIASYATAYPSACPSNTLRYCVKTREGRGLPIFTIEYPSFLVPRMVGGE